LGAYSRYNTQTRDLHAHNTYLEVFIDTGIVGLSGFFIYSGLFLVKTFPRYALLRTFEKKIILAGLSASCLSTFISALFCTNMLVRYRPIRFILDYVFFGFGRAVDKFDEVGQSESQGLTKSARISRCLQRG